MDHWPRYTRTRYRLVKNKWLIEDWIEFYEYKTEQLITIPQPLQRTIITNLIVPEGY